MYGSCVICRFVWAVDVVWVLRGCICGCYEGVWMLCDFVAVWVVNVVWVLCACVYYVGVFILCGCCVSVRMLCGCGLCVCVLYGCCLSVWILCGCMDVVRVVDVWLCGSRYKYAVFV